MSMARCILLPLFWPFIDSLHRIALFLPLPRSEEKEDTGEKVLYVCLEKEIDIEMLEQSGMSMDWVGVLEGEEVVKTYYPEKDKVYQTE